LRNQYTGEDEPESNSGSSSCAQLLSKGSSGESNNADKWFEKSNKNPSLHQRGFTDDDPPFRPNIQSENVNAAVYAHMQSIPPQLLASESSSDEYRGVIDDLTIQLKKLQKKLNKYERLQDNRLDTVKRIEVKTYGLGAEKKRQLEQILSKFSEDLDSLSPSEPKGSSSSMLNSSSMIKGSTSTISRNVLKAARFKPSETNDSGYGSLAPSGAQSNTTMSYSAMRRAPETTTSPQAKNQSIENYLHDIPVGLLPRQPVAMTEKAKQKLVVKRLEQILGGRDALPGVHHQSIQQQEVAQSAAIAERSAMDSLGQVYAAEGMREAPIMPGSDDEASGLAEPLPEATQGNLKPEHVNEKDFAAVGVDHRPEQRPTRPLDLDPDRAQTPMENVRYLRHLGFMPDETPLAPSSDDEGWIYLNLMTNLAQLHTLNVTPEFVQDAIARYSDRFELSNDGRKVRWSHHTGRSKTSQETKSGFVVHNNNPANNPRKRSLVPLAITEPEAPKNQHLYTPMFLPKEEVMSDDTASIPEEDTFPEGGNDNEVASGSGPMSGATRRRADAPMIFYHQAKFYTDLSADKISPIAFTNYHMLNTPLLGEKPVHRTRRNSVQPNHRPLVDSAPISDNITHNDDDAELVDMDFPATSPRRVTFIEPDEKEVDFAVCGLGGVYPEDHFAITVQRRHSPPSATSPKIKTHSLPNRLITSTQQQHPRRHPSVVSTRRTSLIPSELPPPCYDFNSDSESDSDNDSESSSQSGSGPIPSTTDLPRLATLSTFASQLSNKRRRLNDSSRPFSSTSSTTTSSQRGHANGTRANYSPSTSSCASSTGSNDDDQSLHRGAPSMSEGIDFLAHARRVDPELIGRAERQYDAEMAERLAEEIPAGSSAATAGGGSGWGSPKGAGRLGKRKRSRDDDAETKVDDGQNGEVSECDEDEEVEGGSVAS